MEALTRLSPDSHLPQENPSSDFIQTHWVFSVIKDLLPHLQEHGEQPPTTATRLQAYLITHLHQGPTLKNVAEFLGYSEKYCSQFFQATMGMSFSVYLKNLRIQRAKSLLRETRLDLTAIAHAVGFSDQFAFSHFFKKAVGCSPKQFRTEALRLPADRRNLFDDSRK